MFSNPHSQAFGATLPPVPDPNQQQQQPQAQQPQAQQPVYYPEPAQPLAQQPEAANPFVSFLGNAATAAANAANNLAERDRQRAAQRNSRPVGQVQQSSVTSAVEEVHHVQQRAEAVTRHVVQAQSTHLGTWGNFADWTACGTVGFLISTVLKIGVPPVSSYLLFTSVAILSLSYVWKAAVYNNKQLMANDDLVRRIDLIILAAAVMVNFTMIPVFQVPDWVPFRNSIQQVRGR